MDLALNAALSNVVVAVANLLVRGYVSIFLFWV